jgi:hypothetical protein
MPAGNYRAAYVREYKKRKLLEEGNCNNVPKQSYMPNDSVNIEKHIKLYLLNTCIIIENAKHRRKLNKIERHKHLQQWTLHQLQLYIIIIKPMNNFKRILLVIHLVMPATYVVDYGIRMI